ncbi:MAG: hypothetical protein P8020_03975 [Acidobacteriota bacterium]
MLRVLLLWGMVVTGIVAMATALKAEASKKSGPMSEEKALEILNDSPWARQQTSTRLIQGVGSGEYGEKEIFSRYYVRILSAAPVRRAFERVRDLAQESGATPAGGGNATVPRARSTFDAAHIVIAVAFRSNEPEMQRDVDRTMRSQTLDTIRNRAYISTAGLPQVRPVAYFPPIEPAVGAEFVFPRVVDGTDVISQSDSSFTFAFNLPTHGPDLRVTFPVTPELLSPTPSSATRVDLESSVSEFRITSGQDKGALNLESSRLGALVNQFPQQTTTRAFHGSIYEFHRNDNFDARNFFDPVGQRLPEYKRNQFGFSLNWNLSSDLSLFGSYDGLRINQGSTLVSHVPTEAMKNGDFGDLLYLDTPVVIRDPETRVPFPENRIPADRIDPAAAGLLPLLPNPNRSERVRNFVNGQPVLVNQDSINLRADVALSDISQLAAQYAMDLGEETAVHSLPAFGSQATGNDYEASASYTRVFSERTTGSWRLRYRRNLDSVVPRQGRPAGLVESLGIAGVGVTTPEDEGYPVFDIAGYPEFGDTELPQNEIRNRASVESNLTVVRGDHVLHFNGQAGLRQINDSRSSSLERGSFGFSGTYSGEAFADFLLGRADRALRAIGSSRQDLRRKHFRIGAGDEWRINPRLSLNLGLDYQYFEPYRSIRNNLSVFRPLRVVTPPDGQLIDLEQSGDSVSVGTVVRPDRNDFAPRIGLAYRPAENGRIVIRASYGLEYDPFPSWIFEDFMGRNYPYYYSQEAQASVDSHGLDLSAPFDTTTATELAIRDISPQLRTPYNQRWHLELEDSLSNDWSFNLEYFGRRGVHELRTIPGNVPLPAAGPLQPRRPNTAYGQFSIVTSGGSSIQHRFTGLIDRRFARGLSFQAEFAWGRRFDDEFEEDPSNVRDLRSEWAPTGWYEEKRLSVHFLVDLPFGPGRRFGGNGFVDTIFGGWRLSGIGEIESGDRFTVVLPGDPNNDGLFSDRPDSLGPVNLSSSQQSVDRWFDTEAFAKPAPYTFGNLGRNTVLGPGYHNWDLSLIKDVQFSNDHRIEFRFAFFNAFNHPNFEIPDATYGTESFGVISGARRAREIEIAVKYSF